MKEWNNPFNPFNSMKVLRWWDHLQHCADEDFLPPITVDIDPSNICNYDCVWCNAYDMMNCGNKVKMMSEDHLIKLADFIKDWKDKDGNGPRSACIAGGGEPLTNPGTMALLERFKHNGLEAGLITNGALLTDETIDIIANTCKWVGVSMDAATQQTYNKVKGIKNDKFFEKVKENIKKLTTKHNNVAFKFLIHPYNYNEISRAAKLAKEIGCRDFHLRPVGGINLTKIKQPLSYTSGDLAVINMQIEEILNSYDDDKFHVYGVNHKFNKDFSPKKQFSRCWAIPILPTFGADGWVHTCFDMRGREDLKMCSHYPDPTELAKFWNSEEHKQMVRSIDVSKCPRCTFSSYNQCVEDAIINDNMCINFP